MSKSGWYGVDLDGTLARYDGWTGGQIGEPIPLMLDRVKAWLAEGVEVRIVTARIACTGLHVPGSTLDGPDFAGEQQSLIEQWCLKHIGQKLRVTAFKDFAMVELWDDRAIQVDMNTGRRIGEMTATENVIKCIEGILGRGDELTAERQIEKIEKVINRFRGVKA